MFLESSCRRLLPVGALLSTLGCAELTAVPCLTARNCPTDEVCHIYRNECIVPDLIVDIGPREQGPNDLAVALEGASTEEITLIRVWPRASWSGDAASYQSTARVGGGREIYVVGQTVNGVLPQWAPKGLGAEDSVVRVEDSSRLRLSSLIVDGGEAEAAALSVVGSEVVVENTALRGTGETLALSEGSVVHVAASFISGRRGLHLDRNDEVLLRYSTVVATEAVSACEGEGLLELRNSLLASPLGIPSATACDYELPRTYVDLELNPDYFVDPEAGDFHLRPSAAPAVLSDYATLEEEGPVEDIDGDSIAAISYPGADQPVER
ncbi:hypothetical protein G6O69_17420 [Pseudenhygromyxa sp. WMMC2535]|uniref:hypothetical protein n=1 Tax=Pseudenhygromyxa sp. WMMC2535 TaxID=2712867 RepID=UPI0015518A55|nr:hypothetical protein [Pseudenhygromyxa sp. WMMC2535]NVB39626.1 hypothetical protein [Pseudenhygromyxa sp. WMMC2535]